MSNYFMETQHHEWIQTNRVGGYTLGTGNLVNQRKYHGLLIGGYENFERRHLLASLEERLEWRGEEMYLDSNNYAHCIYPEGFLHLVKSWLRPWPTLLYSSFPHNDAILVKKEIMLHREANIVLVRYENMGHHLLHFHLRPKVTLRNHHQVNPPGTWDEEKLAVINGLAGPGSCHIMRPSNRIKLYGYALDGTFDYETIIYRNVFYPWEVSRGYDGHCDMIAPVRLDFVLPVGAVNYVLFSDAPVDDLDSVIQTIQEQYAARPKPIDYPTGSGEGESIIALLDYDGHDLYSYDDYLRVLADSLRDFFTRDDMIAGYPWFGVWGRDTMFSLGALFDIPNGHDLAWNILTKYASHLNRGLIPNVFREHVAEGNFDSLDATLWFVLLLYKGAKEMARHERTQKAQSAHWRKAITTTRAVLRGIRAERERFCLRADGLLELQPHFAHATWMDARIEDVPLTPRDGAPVEVNALWYNALCFYEKMIEKHNEAAPAGKRIEAEKYVVKLKAQVKDSFGKFIVDDYLADRLVGDEPDRSIRPNALIACSLPFEIVSHKTMRTVLHRVERELLTPYGIRTLAPSDYRFKKKYFGSQVERDKAYHQGSVWAWLLSPYATLWRKVHGDNAPNTWETLSRVICKFRNGYRKGHIASVAEVWDGDRPHFPKGCPAQAWSVAAIYHIERMLQSCRPAEVD
ncbi:MAG: amylo-alpha-1,6-glucosidase [Candidatus Cloacimonetes bacterium]|nr:amylo-alpha-1,6-glucosidase [Candidatus Cloacimonadota bacterium]